MSGKKIVVVSPFPPPFGGMAVQAEKLCKRLAQNYYDVAMVKTNADFPSSLAWVKKIPFIRTILNTLLVLMDLNSKSRQAECVYILSGFFNFFFWITLPALLLIKLKGKRVILNARGGGAGEFFKYYRCFLLPIINCIDFITVPSEFLRKVFKDAFDIDAVIVRNIADLDQFSYVERTELTPRFIIARNLEPIYNVGCALKAFQIIKKRHAAAVLGIVGDGSLRSELEKMVETLGLKGAVVFHGQVDHHLIPKLYSQYDIMLNSSNVDNLPGVILEAFASGIPVVTSDAGGIPYLVEDSVSGLLVPRNNPELLAEKALFLLNSPGVAKRLTQNGFKACQLYSWDRIQKNLFPCLDGVECKGPVD